MFKPGYGLIRVWRAEPLGKPSWRLFVPKDYVTPCPTLLLGLGLLGIRVVYTLYEIHPYYGVDTPQIGECLGLDLEFKTQLRSHNLEIR